MEDCIQVIAVSREKAHQKAQIHTLYLDRTLLKAAGCEYTSCYSAQVPNHSPWNDTTLQKQTEDVIRVISLFSGAGMLDHTFQKDDRFKLVYAAEYAHDAVETYRANIGDHIKECDIRILKGRDLPKADIIIGGPPCQPFSNANRHNQAREERHPEGDMFSHYIRLVKETGVKAFLIENVPGLLSAKMGYYMDLLKQELPNFQLVKKIVTDCDLGGFTKRKRAIIIGSRIGTPCIPDVKVRPTRTAGSALKTVDKSWPNFADITLSSPLVKKKISLIPEGGNWMDLPKEFWTKSVHSNMYRRIDRSKPAISIANWRKFLLSPPRWDDSDEWDRILSVSEAAALQGLDKHFTFLGTLNSMQQMVANGVTAAIAKYCKNIIAGLFMTYRVLYKGHCIV